MDLITRVALAGGLFAVFTFIHFLVDWIFQTHSEAMAKHNNPWIRARHCLIYTVGFIPLLLVLGLAWWEVLISANILFWSHFVEDTYLPVYLWAKYIRRPPEMTDPWKETFKNVDGSVSIKVNPPDARRGFLEFVKTPLGKILMIAVDQIIHLAFLFPIVWLVLRHITNFIK